MADIVELNLPVEADLVVLARLTTAAIASRAELDTEEIEDLRLAVDELCLSAIRGRVEGRIDLQFISGDGCIDISCRHHSASTAADGAGSDSDISLSALLLEALVDEHGVNEDGTGLRSTWLRKRRADHLG